MYASRMPPWKWKNFFQSAVSMKSAPPLALAQAARITTSAVMRKCLYKYIHANIHIQMHTLTHMQTYIHQHGQYKSGTYINIVLNTKAESLEQRFTFIHHPDAETFVVNVLLMDKRLHHLVSVFVSRICCSVFRFAFSFHSGPPFPPMINVVVD